MDANRHEFYNAGGTLLREVFSRKKAYNAQKSERTAFVVMNVAMGGITNLKLNHLKLQTGWGQAI